MSTQDILLITGANTGIGYEAVKALLQSQKQYHIFLGSRSTDKGNEAIAQLKKDFPESKSSVELLQVDISKDDSIHKAVAHIESKFGKLDVLVNNAGEYLHTETVYRDFTTDSLNAGTSLDSTTDQDASRVRELYNKTYDTNISGTQVITTEFIPLLLKSTSPRLLFLTSGLSTLENSSQSFMPKIPVNLKAGWPKEGVMSAVAYRASKAALNMVMLSWHWLLSPDGVRVWCISPGFLATGLGGIGKERLEAAGAGPAWKGGDIIKRVVEGERDADVGKVVAQDGQVQPW